MEVLDYHQRFGFILIALMSGFGEGSASEQPYTKVCAGSKDPIEMELLHPSTVLEIMTMRYSGCTHIINHLSISQLKKNDDLSFLSSIVQVNGSVVISNNAASVIRLRKLRLIRGRVCRKSGSREYSLIITGNRSPVNGNPAFVDLYSLKSVSRCNIFVGWNQGLCNLRTIGFQRMLAGKAQEVKFMRDSRKCSISETCSKNCTAIKSKRYCWGPLPTMCMSVARYQGQCHEECLDGCSGPTNGDCDSCRHQKDGRRCVKSCPRDKFTFFSQCVRTCPKRYLKSGRNCVVNCPSGSYPYYGQCASCPTPQCDIVCRPQEWVEPLLKKKPGMLGKVIYKDGSLSHTPRTFLKEIGRRECTVLDGDILISAAASKDQGFNEFVRRRDLQNLKKLRHINGFVHLYLEKYPRVESLSFLSNLETISTPKLGRGLEIYWSMLERLQLMNLKFVDAPLTYMDLNPRLCRHKFKRRYGIEVFGRADRNVRRLNCIRIPYWR